jgi:hypothetical protein
MLVPYEGGPVVYCPTVYTSFWGPSWNGTNAALAGQLNQFVQDLLAAKPWMNILTQYGVSGSGAFVQASYLEYVPGTLTVSGYEAIFQACVNAGLIPEPANVNSSKTVQVMMVFLDQNVVINGGGRQLNLPGAPDAGYHDSFTTAAGNPFLYAFSEFTNIQSISTIMSHEFAEMITDPLYNAWTPDHAGHEIGDYCAWDETTITVSGRTWTVQEIWSDAANACVANSANKIPPISPGPGGLAGADGTPMIRLGRGPGKALDPADVLPHHRVLPLPSVRFNHLTGEKQTDNADMLAYTRKLFSPLRHEHLFDNFPAFLRDAAAAVESRGVAVNGMANGKVADATPAEAPAEASATDELVDTPRRQGVTPKPPARNKETTSTS